MGQGTHGRDQGAARARVKATAARGQQQGASSTESGEESVMDYKLEVVVVPVSDVDKAKDFYQALGWRLDADFDPDGNGWFVQEITTRLPGR